MKVQSGTGRTCSNFVESAHLRHNSMILILRQEFLLRNTTLASSPQVVTARIEDIKKPCSSPLPVC